MNNQQQVDPLQALDPSGRVISKLVRSGGTVGIGIMDGSGSMADFGLKPQDVQNEYIASLRKEPGYFFAGGVIFADESRVAFPIQHVHIAEMTGYVAAGSTLLYVTVDRTLQLIIKQIDAVPETERSEHFHCIVGVYTDGFDNKSKEECGHPGYPQKLQETAARARTLGIDLCTFGFGVPADDIAEQMGFPQDEGCCQTFERKAKALSQASRMMTARSTLFVGRRSDGIQDQSTGATERQWSEMLERSEGQLFDLMSMDNTSIVVLMVDGSSSIWHLQGVTEKALQGFIDNQRVLQDGKHRHLAIVSFTKTTDVLLQICDISTAPHITEFRPDVGTRLIGTVHDVMKLFLDTADKLHEAIAPDLEVAFAVFSDGQDSCSNLELSDKLGVLTTLAQSADLGWRLFACGIGRPGEEVAAEIHFPPELAFTVERTAEGIHTGTSRLEESLRITAPRTRA